MELAYLGPSGVFDVGDGTLFEKDGPPQTVSDHIGTFLQGYEGHEFRVEKRVWNPTTATGSQVFSSPAPNFRVGATPNPPPSIESK